MLTEKLAMSVEEDRMDEILDVADLARELYDLKVKYERLKDGHRKLVSVNQSLEDKLLQNINRYETDKFSLVHNISTLNLQLEELQRINQRLLAENVIVLTVQTITQLNVSELNRRGLRLTSQLPFNFFTAGRQLSHPASWKVYVIK